MSILEAFAPVVVIVLLIVVISISYSPGKPHPFRAPEGRQGCPGGWTWPFGPPEIAALPGGPQARLAPAASCSLISTHTVPSRPAPVALS